MKLVKSLLLGAPAAMMAFAGANAADLPSRKAAPVAYVKICDAYGAGFFYIPGTDTCLKVGGYVRAEYQYTPKAAQYYLPAYGAFGGVGGFPAAGYVSKNRDDEFGIRTRGRVDLDARTQSAWGTVRTVIGLRIQTQSGQYPGYPASGAAGNAPGPTVEAAFVQFAGFTAGRAGENFAFMPPFTWTGQHFWAGYPTGIKQLAYTATFGGGFSATLAIEDRADFYGMTGAGTLAAAPGLNGYTGYAINTSTPGGGANGAFLGAPGWAPTQFPNSSPALVANLRVDQAWGSAQLMGTVGQNRATTSTLPTVGGVAYDSPTFTKTGFAIGAGLKFNLPMLAAGDSLWLTAAYADGFLDQLQGFTTTTNNPDSNQNSRGVYRADQNMYVLPNADGTYSTGQTKGFSLGALLVHYWAPTWRSVFAASYTNLTPPGQVRAADWSVGGLSKVTGYNLSGSLIWAPVTNFDVGLEVQYRKINQSINCVGSRAYTASYSCSSFANVAAGGSLTPNTLGGASSAKVSPGTFDARLRVQRTF